MGLAHSPHIVRDSLIRYHDAGNVKSYPGSGLIWKDLSGKGNDGSNSTGANAASFESSEPKCFDFDQTQSRIMGSPLYNSINAGSVELWYQHNQSTFAETGMLYFEGNENGLGIEKELHFSQNTNGTLRLFIESQTNDLSVITTDTIPANTWTCATVTFTNLLPGSGGVSAKIYINGSLSTSGSSSGSHSGFHGDPTNSFIGRSRTKIGSIFRKLVGKIAVVKCYSKQLSDSEVLQNYNALKSRFGV